MYRLTPNYLYLLLLFRSPPLLRILFICTSQPSTRPLKLQQFLLLSAATRALTPLSTISRSVATDDCVHVCLGGGSPKSSGGEDFRPGRADAARHAVRKTAGEGARWRAAARQGHPGQLHQGKPRPQRCSVACAACDVIKGGIRATTRVAFLRYSERGAIRIAF